MPRKGFLDYERYDPSRSGFGSRREWRQAFNATMGLDEASRLLRSRTPESILGIAIGATWPEVETAYRRCALACHPDRCAVHGLPPDVATERFKMLTAAFTLLKHRRGR